MSSSLERELGILSNWSIHSHQVVGESELLHWKIPGDLVIRSDSTTEQRLHALAAIVSEELSEPIRMVQRTADEMAVVATGQLASKPIVSAWGYPNLHVYSDVFGEEDDGGGGGSGDVEKFCQYIGQVVGVPFVDETDFSGEDISWFHHKSWIPLLSE